jgi:hypothetical protein
VQGGGDKGAKTFEQFLTYGLSCLIPALKHTERIKLKMSIIFVGISYDGLVK